MSALQHTEGADLDVAAALAGLPSCSRCRRRRIKCDSLLPSCNNCEKSNEACEYSDHVLGRPVSRAYLESLAQRYEYLTALKATKTSHSVSTQESTPRSSAAETSSSLPWVTLSTSDQNNNDSFWGPSSAYTRLGTLLIARSNIPEAGLARTSSILGDLNLPPIEHTSVNLPPLEMCERFLEVYYQSIEIIFPILGRAGLTALLNEVFRCTPAPAESQQILYLLCAIVLLLLGARDRQHWDHAKHYFNTSLKQSGVKTMPVVTRLQYLLLICLYHLLSLEPGEIWSCLGMANQIAVEEFPLLLETKHVHLYFTLNSLSIEVSGAYGRPASQRFTISLPSETEYESAVAFQVHRLSAIQHRIHAELMNTEYRSDQVDSCAVSSSFREELSNWILDWNLAISPTSDDRPNAVKWLQLIGAILYDKCLMRTLEIPGDGAKDAQERRNVAARFIENCDQLYFLDTKVERNEDAEKNVVQIYPFFWTHGHQIFSAALTILQYGGNIHQDNVSLEKGLKLLLKLNPSQKMLETLWSLRPAPTT